MKITLERFITKYLICEISSILKEHPFLAMSAMSIMSIGVELLGKCLKYNSVDEIKNKGDHESKKNFNYAIENLDAFKEYKNLIHSKDIELYNNLRCGFAHTFMVKDEIILAQGGLSVAGRCRCLTKDSNTSIEKEGYIPYSLQA